MHPLLTQNRGDVLFHLVELAGKLSFKRNGQLFTAAALVATASCAGPDDCSDHEESEKRDRHSSPRVGGEEGDSAPSSFRPPTR